MSETYYQTLPDSTGDKFRTIQKTVNSQNVQEEVVIPDVDMKRLITGKYILSTGIINGSATNPYNYASLFNPSGSGKIAVVRRWFPICWAAAAAVYIELATYRVTAASAGTQIAAVNIPKKDSVDENAVLEVRHTNVTATPAGAKVSSLLSAGAVAQTPFVGVSLQFDPLQEIVLREGQGLCLRQEAVGDADFRIAVLMEWDEFTGAPRL